MSAVLENLLNIKIKKFEKLNILKHTISKK